MKGFHRLTPEARRRLLEEEGSLTAEDVRALARGESLSVESADALVENVIGVHSLPLGVLPELRVNGRSYRVPMAVEEPSVVAAASHAARIAGEIEAEGASSLTVGQLHLVGVTQPARLAGRLRAEGAGLTEAANRLLPGLVERGGGARALEVRLPGEDLVVVHLIVDTVDAMGANAVNTAMEGIAPAVERIARSVRAGGRVLLKILSNLADRRLARARVRIPEGNLAWHGHSGAQVAEGVSQAGRCAELDPYRAVTHNKGIMNGVDAVAVATGNDWRALEAAAHAYAARSGRYAPLSHWERAGGTLRGRLEVPIPVGIVGGTLAAHPGAKRALRLLGVGSARELSAVMAAVGLVQNLAALKALATEGIQRGHMARHARALALAAGARGPEIEAVARALLRSGAIQPHAAREALQSLRRRKVRG